MYMFFGFIGDTKNLATPRQATKNKHIKMKMVLFLCKCNFKTNPVFYLKLPPGCYSSTPLIVYSQAETA